MILAGLEFWALQHRIKDSNLTTNIEIGDKLLFCLINNSEEVNSYRETYYSKFYKGIFGNLNKAGKTSPDWAITHVEASPTESFIIENTGGGQVVTCFDLPINKRPGYQHFDLNNHP